MQLGLRQQTGRVATLAAVAATLALVSAPGAGAQDLALEVQPASLDLKVGDKITLEVILKDPDGNEVEGEIVFFSTGRRIVGVSRRGGEVEAISGGEARIIAMALGEDGRPTRVRVNVDVTVAWPTVERIDFAGIPDRMYTGNTYSVVATAISAGDMTRPDLDPMVRSSDRSVLAPSVSGRLKALQAGKVTLSAEADGVEGSVSVEVETSPVRSVSVSAAQNRARTGDVLTIEAAALDSEGNAVEEAPISFAVQASPTDTLIAPPASAQISQEGKFVAEKPGVYTVFASSGGATGSVELQIEGREAVETVKLLGQGRVGESHTSDLWVFEGVDGRDYAVTGTWGADGKAYFWDVTDPTSIVKVDSIQVDARTVNDVKVSEDGRTAVISREGASSRRNGLVILDVSDPHAVEIVAEYDDELTGGVHNVFIHADHIYALSAGQRYDIINIEDPSNPHRVGRFELETPGHSIHDVWVEDGVAYSSNWSDGVVLVDVGNGIKGGTPSNPVFISSYAYPSGANHAAFPFRSQSTGKFYVIAGDEIMPQCQQTGPDKPCAAEGYMHFIDFTDLENPKEVARYQVPGAGAHNLWVEGDRLYAAFYNGGVRVVDISGELMGDLFRQGREIAHYLAYDGEGFLPNAPMTWGPQPHKGNLFFTEFNSGLWAVQLTPKDLVP